MRRLIVSNATSLDGYYEGPDKDVAIASASIMQQCLGAGLLDEIHIDLVPVLLGGASASSPTWTKRQSLSNVRERSKRRASHTSSSAS